jgi:hypothetical protein
MQEAEMSRRYHITLMEEQLRELQDLRDHDPLAYIRVKSAGILKVAEGLQLKEIAEKGLLKPIDPETVRRWCERYLHEGRAGLVVQVGRGRKPAFSPCAS